VCVCVCVCVWGVCVIIYNIFTNLDTMKKKQFGEVLGEFPSLPHEVSIMNFVSSRAHEISAMTSSIGMLKYFNSNILIRMIIVKFMSS